MFSARFECIFLIFSTRFECGFQVGPVMNVVGTESVQLLWMATDVVCRLAGFEMLLKVKTTLQTSGEDVKLHSKRVEKM
jgi:hypothetical protein